ncbi:MAG: PDZ domain-containing protein [Candidatus Cloacimonetes bacterium]|nr:PDZ domain-containing protein [Candidatus Cloacimonadota bacterium]MCF7813611.1 PDZ domain-containing protein [Candidatus Cloacimonadota bacterium]MCF7867927.1 PDZ domain-containing protein [Candidatus Cloacimonadota bacterium]MCF7882880.1 PDZ domain-containing protein [Candidatus Cloacimonadota bacterium]
MNKKRVYVMIFVLVLMLSSTIFAAEKGKVYMGVYLDDVSYSYYQKAGLDENYGILISKVVSDTPADKAGLMSKDILLEIDGDKIYTHGQFTKMLKNYAPGDKVKLKYFRDGKVKSLKLTFGEKEFPKIKKKAYMGVFLAELNGKYKQKTDYDKNFGIVITDVVEDGPAQKAGIKDDSIIMSINGDKIYTIDQLTKMLTNYEPENHIEVEVFQDKKEVKLDMILGEKAQYKHFDLGLGGSYNLSFEKPENVFVYQYTPDNTKWIGVMLHVVENTKGDEKKITVTIDEVIEGTPAGKAGLQAGDIILAVDDNEIDSRKLISKIINKKEVGDTINMKIDRKGTIVNLACEIAEREEEHRYEKVELSMDDGDIKVFVNGEERILSDIEDVITDQMEDIKILRQEEIEKAMQDAKKQMEDLDELEIHFGQSGAI